MDRERRTVFLGDITFLDTGSCGERADIRLDRPSNGCPDPGSDQWRNFPCRVRILFFYVRHFDVFALAKRTEFPIEFAFEWLKWQVRSLKTTVVGYTSRGCIYFCFGDRCFALLSVWDRIYGGSADRGGLFCVHFRRYLPRATGRVKRARRVSDPSASPDEKSSLPRHRFWHAQFRCTFAFLDSRTLGEFPRRTSRTGHRRNAIVVSFRYTARAGRGNSDLSKRHSAPLRILVTDDSRASGESERKAG